MKKNYSFYLTLLCIPIIGMLFFSWETGMNGIYLTGSAADNAAVGGTGNCTLCHGGNAVMTNSGTITLTVPSEYELNTTYNITVESSSVAVRQGFQVSAEADGSGDKVGDFIDDGVNNQDFDLGRGEAITHTTAGGFSTPWTFQWTSPATDLGPITFYAALNETNNNSMPDGDQVHLKQSPPANLLSVESVIFKDLKVYPNPAQDLVTIDLPSQLENDTHITVYDFLGKQVQAQAINSVNNTLNVSEWQSGVYLMQIAHEDATIVKRFVKL